MRIQTEAAPHALQAQSYGDRLRVVRSLLPNGGRLNRIVDAEAAVAESSRLLENAAREHVANLSRLNVLRQREKLALLPVPSVAELTAAAGADLVGRVTKRDRLTHLTKTGGQLELVSGEVVTWTAAASYVDALDVLFDGVPIIVTGPFLNDGSLSIQSVLPAPRSYWRDGEDFQDAEDLGAMTVMVASMLKKDLAKKHGSACQVCGHSFSNLTQAAIADLVNGAPALVCRPCKEDWKQSLKAPAVSLVKAVS